MTNVPKKEFSEEAEAAISVLRALVSSKKGPSTMQSILNDYRELEGTPLMYRKFGFANADDFLRTSGEFIVQNKMDDTVVFVKPSKESAHILKMVAAQKGTKTKKSGFSILRQPQKRTGGYNWNPSAYHKMYAQMPNKKRYLPQSQPQFQHRNSNINNQSKSFLQNSSASTWLNNTRNNSLNNGSSGNQIKPLMSLKISPPSPPNNKLQNAQQNPSIQRQNRVEPNNNSIIKNYNKNSQIYSKIDQSTLPSNDLRHKLIERGPQLNQRQSSSLELKNRLNQRDPIRPHFMNNLAQPPVKDFAQKIISTAVVSSQTYALQNSPIQPIQSTLDNRSVNSRLQVTKNVSPTSPITPEMTKVYPVYDVTMHVDVHPHSTVASPMPVVSPIIPTKTVQDRLKIHQQVDSSDLEKVAKIVAPIAPVPKTPDVDPKSPTCAPLTPPDVPNSNRPKEPFTWANEPTATPVEILQKYAECNDLPRPSYTYYKLKNKRVQCRVMINGSTYSTYPDDFANQFEGQFAAAQIAIENIKRDEELNNYSVCLDSDYEIATKIHELLLQYPHGMFSKNIPEAFRNAHQMLLPDHWEFIIMSHSHMFSKEDTIIFAIVYDESDSNNSSNTNTSEAKSMSANVLQLPWGEQYWNLYITNPVSTVEIWARLVGPQYSSKMDELLTDIELGMMGDDKPKPPFVAVGEYYLVSTNDCWFRVRVEGIDNTNNYCVCFFIDIGEWQRIALDEIYVCEAKYLELPGQSVCFTLDGLEDFGENPKAKSHLDNLICGKVCIGEILTHKEEYEKDGQGNLNDRINIVLYDTSSDKDVNLNPLLLKHICDDTPVPELYRKGVTTVIVTHVDDSGDVYCQIKDDAMLYIQKLINNLVKSNALDGTHRGVYKVKTAEQQLYLVQDEKDKRWYRASLEAAESGSFFRMLYVDVGCKKSVNLSNVYRLETLSVALSRYPAQAVRMKMFDIPEVSDYLLSRMRVLLKTGLTAMVKVAALSVVPLVKIYMHLGQNHILVCVNDSIRSEMELEIASEVISNPRVTAYESDNTSEGSSFKINTTLASDYSIESNEAVELFKNFKGLNITQRKPGIPVASQITPKLAKYSLPSVGELFSVFVTIASNPNYFIVQPYMHARELNTMMVDLQTYCENQAQPVPKDNVKQGEVYAGLNTDDGHWYRVLAVNILGGTIHVYFCDFGQIRVLDSASLRMLPPQSRILPQQAVKAKLHGILPLHGDWTTEDAVRFQQLTVDKKFSSYICNILTDEFNPNEQIVELMLIDVSTDEDIFIHKILVDEKRAVLIGK